MLNLNLSLIPYRGLVNAFAGTLAMLNIVSNAMLSMHEVLGRHGSLLTRDAVLCWAVNALDRRAAVEVCQYMMNQPVKKT